MPIHVVAQGDCVMSIAEKNGFFWETLWNHAENAELKKLRADPAVLFPGDRVFVPEKRVKEVNEPTNQVHKFRVKNAPAKLRLRFLDDSGKPRANISYVLDIDGRTFEGSTDGEGGIAVSIPPDAKKGTLVFTGEDEEYDLMLGFLDPVEKVAGVQARLRGLGFYDGETTGVLDDETKEAIAEFQASIKVEQTGELSDELKEKLKNEYGS